MFENLPSLNVLNFFNVKIDCHKLISREKLLNKKYLVKSFSYLFDEEDLVKVYMAWDEKGLYFIFDVSQPFTKASLEFKKTDSVEIFIDTRSLKTKGYITKFCHHFVFFAQEADGRKGYEVSRFRADDMHKLCDPQDLIVEAVDKPKAYLLSIEIPAACLIGYNPLEINYFSFTYRVNRFEKSPLHFAVSSIEHNIEKSPHLWAKFNLIA